MREKILEAPISHETDPHCCGCWVFYKTGLTVLAKCNECGIEQDIVDLLRAGKPHKELVERISQMQSEFEGNRTEAWRNGYACCLEILRRETALHSAALQGQWVHCSPDLINAGVSCDRTPRRDCACGLNGSHDHWIAHSAAAALDSADTGGDSTSQRTGGQTTDTPGAPAEASSDGLLRGAAHVQRALMAEDDSKSSALRKIASHEPRRHNGRSRSFINWQNAYEEIKHLARKELGSTGGAVGRTPERATGQVNEKSEKSER